MASAQELIFGLVICGLWFGFLIRDIVRGQITLRGGVVQRRDNPFLFWLVAAIGFAWGLVVAGMFFGEDLTALMPGTGQPEWPF